MKVKQFIEINFAFLLVLFFANCTRFLTGLVQSVPDKMLFMVLPYILMVGFVFFLSKIKNRSVFAALGISIDKLNRQFLIAIAAFLITAFLFVIAPLFLGAELSDVLSFKKSSPGIITFYIVYYMFFVGLGEEIVWRGYFYETLKKYTDSGTTALILSSLLFGIWHYPVSRNIFQVICTTIIGLIYGFARLKIKECSVISTGIAHGMHDTFIFLLSCLLLK